MPGKPGFLNTAYQFGASGSWVRVPHASSLNPEARAFSVAARVKLSRLPVDEETFDVIRKGTATARGGEFKLEILKDGKVRCIVKDANRVRAAITGSFRMRVTTGAWHHVGCERTGTSWSVVVNSLKRSQLVLLGSVDNTLDLSIGSNYGNEDFVAGLVDEVELNVG